MLRPDVDLSTSAPLHKQPLSPLRQPRSQHLLIEDRAGHQEQMKVIRSYRIILAFISRSDLSFEEIIEKGQYCSI